MAPQSKEEKLVKKRLAKRLRFEKIKNNPILHAQYKEKERQKYLKRKLSGKIVPIAAMSPRHKKNARKKSRESSNRFNAKKKTKKLQEVEEVAVYEDTDTSVINTDTEQDPLTLNPPQSPNKLRVESPPPPSPVSSVSTTSSRMTRSAKSKDLNQTPVPEIDFASNLTQFNDTEMPSSPQSSISDRSETSPRRRQPVKITKNQGTVSMKKKSPWKYLLRRMKYRTHRELHIKDTKIFELKQINEKYRKQLQRLRNSKTDKKRVEKLTQITQRNEILNETLTFETIKIEMKRDIEKFLEEDENSRLCPGKKEYITRNKEKKQKRYLNFSLQQLHQKFLKQHPEYKISYAFFCKLRPFWTVIPKANNRETCLCTVHENMDLAVAALKRNGVIAEKTSYDVLKSLCCDTRNVKCLHRKCDVCKNRHLNYQEFENSKETIYWIWTKAKKTYKKNGQDHVTMQSLKQKVPADIKTIIEHFEKLLEPYMSHCANIVAQNSYIKNLKSNLKTEECLVHCDFSENYNTKYASEIQAFHFGSSRQQVTLHTSVIYYVKNGKLSTKSFCTLSECLRHDAIAIWEHLIPILNFIESVVPEVENVHFLSDSPSAQYRNRKMFYIMSKLHWNYPSLRRVVWNYSEKGHGKGAPDGVGAVLKRTADMVVAQGNDVPNIDVLMTYLKDRCTGVAIEEVFESGILERELLISSDLKEFRGTMGVHQVIWSSNNPEVLAMRRLSCNLGKCSEESVQCPHGQHLGFYQILNTAADNPPPPAKNNIQAKRKTTATKKKNKAKNSALIKRSKPVNPSLCHNGRSEITVPNDLPVESDDSFWTEVPSIVEHDIMSSSMANAVFSAIQSDSDENIF